ncbi:MAG: DUF4287 domain-containing protein [Candidatus Promineifilaceae bacterium]
MIENMPEKTGKPLEEWFSVLSASGLEKHGQLMKVLKGEYGVSHGYANTIVILYRQQEAGGEPKEEDLTAAQYEGAKAKLKPIYEALISEVNKFGSDVEIAPKKTYVSLRRSKQFAIVQAATKSRVDLGLNLKEVEAGGRLEGGNVFSGMCTHKVRLTEVGQVDQEVVGWLKQAYSDA